MIVSNANGRSFFVRVVFCGEKYGRDDCLTHDKDEPMIEFYDRATVFVSGPEARGQFVSRYNAGIIALHRGGLCLHGGVPEWNVDAPAMGPVIETAKALCRDLAITPRAY